MKIETTSAAQLAATKASARGVAHAEQALRDGANSDIQEHQALLSAAYFTMASGLLKVRIPE